MHKSTLTNGSVVGHQLEIVFSYSKFHANGMDLPRKSHELMHGFGEHVEIN